jgi:threonylcarbamoyladenosine tRNA methylthiotransferase MtaB
MGKVAVFTIGCKVNQGESEELKISLSEVGHHICADPREADLCVVNTCSVTAESDRKCRKLIRCLGRRGARGIVAAGCYAQTKPGELRDLPGVKRVLSRSEKENWLLELEKMIPAPAGAVAATSSARARGFVKVQDGCERRCSYCIVPTARGPERSRPVGEILRVTGKWLQKGSREIVLCGINLGRYRLGEGFDLSSLIRELLSLQSDYRIRISSLELEDLRFAWLEEWAASGRVCPHIHLPLQSGDAEVLRDMGRGYSPEEFVAAAGELRRVWPGVTLTTEVIVGYPGESKEAFNRTLEVLEEIQPSKTHVFRFSPRPGTLAYERGYARGNVAPGEAEKRSTVLREQAEKWRRSYMESCLGQRHHLLVERIAVVGGVRRAVGTTENYLKAYLDNPPGQVRPGSIIEAEVRAISGGHVSLEVADDRISMAP